MIHADFFNNVYFRTSYDTALYFPDTSFHHTEQYHNNGNFVISKYSDQGTFIEALDLHAVPGGNITYPKLVTDSASCMYLCFPFRKKVFIKDTFLTIAPTPYPGQPDVLIAKVDENYDLMWSGLSEAMIGEIDAKWTTL